MEVNNLCIEVMQEYISFSAEVEEVELHIEVKITM